MVQQKLILLECETSIHRQLGRNYLTGKGKLLLSFFCQIVEVVIEINATIVATKPNIGMFDPISHP